MKRAASIRRKKVRIGREYGSVKYGGASIGIMEFSDEASILDGGL
jgi:hypothetical protein